MSQNRPGERFRLYLDESGDHVFRKTSQPGHRYLCLLGCWFRRGDYDRFHKELEGFKEKHLQQHPDDPVILHRTDIVNRRKRFWCLREPAVAKLFDKELLALVERARFKMVGIVIDKKALVEQYVSPDHPYNLALKYMLQIYCGYLNYINRSGDVMAESRGGTEDRVLKSAFTHIYKHGEWFRNARFYQQALTSKELKLKPKIANTAGLQLADLLAHPVRKAILVDNKIPGETLSSFGKRLLKVIEPKFNYRTGDGRVQGYGKVLFP